MKKKRKFVLVIIYIFILLALFEGFARITFSSEKRARRLWANESTSWQRSWVQRHKSTGKEIYYKFDEYDSTKGWKTIPNITDMTVFEDKILNTNSIGLRGKTEYQLKKDPYKLRILILGDSYTFGEEVSDNETYPYYLENINPNYAVINLGVHGYGHDQMLITLKELGNKYNPDIVLLGFIHADMKRNMVNFRDFAKPQFRVANGQLVLTNVPVPSPDTVLKWDWLRPRIYDIFTIIRHQIAEKTGRYEIKKNKVTTAILNEIKNECDKIDATPIFIYLPIIPEIYSNEIRSEGEYYLAKLCGEEITYFSTRPYLLNQVKKGVIFKERGHWGSNGNHAIAEAINQFLLENESITDRVNNNSN